MKMLQVKHKTQSLRKGLTEFIRPVDWKIRLGFFVMPYIGQQERR
jgi:hypothetical protein